MRAIGGLTEEDIDSTLSSTNIESPKAKKSLLWVPGDEEEGEM